MQADIMYVRSVRFEATFAMKNPGKSTAQRPAGSQVTCLNLTNHKIVATVFNF